MTKLGVAEGKGTFTDIYSPPLGHIIQSGFRISVMWGECNVPGTHWLLTAQHFEDLGFLKGRR